MQTKTVVGRNVTPLFVLFIVGALFLFVGTWVAAKPLLATHTLPTCDEAGFNAALGAALADAGVGVVAFPGGCTGNFPLTSEKMIASDIVIDGGNSITLTAGSGLRHFVVPIGGDLLLRDIALAGGSSTLGGSIAVEGGNLRALRTVFSDNQSPDSRGGAIYANTGTIRVLNSSFVQNDGGISGGAIYATSASIWITDTQFLSNTAISEADNTAGGAISSSGGDVTQIVNSTFVGNRSRNGWGGALWVINGPLQISRSDFTDNRAGSPTGPTQSNGGAIYATGAEPLLLTNSLLSDNYSAARGGALYTADSLLLITRTTFLSNTTDWHGNDGQGGALYASSLITDSQIVSSTFESNYASSSAGGIYQSLQEGFSPISIRSSTFASNLAQFNAPALRIFKIGAASPYTIAIENSTFFSNTGSNGALAAIQTNRVPLALRHVTIAGNGGGMQVTEANATIANSILNSADGSCDISLGAILMIYSASTDPNCHFGGSNNLDFAVDLAALQDNGGETLTMLPFADSPAIDSVPAGLCLPGDQRGTARPQGADCDMGAVELAPSDPQVTATPTPTADPSSTPTHTPTGTLTETPTPTPTATSTSPATQTAVAATATAQATLTPQPSPSVTPMANPVYLSPVQNASAPRP